MADYVSVVVYILGISSLIINRIFIIQVTTSNFESVLSVYIFVSPIMALGSNLSISTASSILVSSLATSSTVLFSV
jgi:hypothetical protein